MFSTSLPQPALTSQAEADAQRIARACIRANAHTTTQQALGKLPTAPLTPVVIKEVIEWR